MSFIFRLIIIGIISFYMPKYLPWWSIIIITFGVGFAFDENYFSHFLSGFIGVGTAWLFLLLSIDSSTNSVISNRIIDFLEISSVNMLIIYTSIIGGFLGGIGSCTGKSLKEVIFKKKIKRDFKF
tara:strand:- start:417 stop:791 length:375 start_codon:yes stop_codon:yes gene_type:complete